MSYETSGSSVLINTTIAGTQRYGDIAALEGGGTIVVWEETDANGTGILIRAQRLTEQGRRIGGEIAVTPTADTAGKGAPSVATLEDGGFVVVWYDTMRGVISQRFDAFGQKVGEALTLDAVAGTSLSAPSVTATLGGGYAVSWQRGSGSSSDVYAQMVGADGTRIGGTIAVTAADDGVGQFYGATAGLLTGGAVTVWKDGDGTIKAQRLGSIGIAIGEPVTVGTGVGQGAAEPAVVALAEGGYVVVWSSYDSGLSEVHARLFTDSGTPLGAAFTVASGTESFVSGADVAASRDGGFTVSWKGFAYAGADGADVFARSYTAGGAPDGEVFTLNTVRSGQQTDGAVAIDRDGRLVGIWTDGSGNALDIEGQVFTPETPPVEAPAAGARPAPAFDAGNVTFKDGLGVADGGTTQVLADGSYVRLWSEIVDGTRLLRVQLFDSDNRPAGGPFTAYSQPAGELSGVSVTALKNGGFVVTCEREEAGSDGSTATRIETQVYTGTGKAVGGPVVSGSGGNLYHELGDSAGLADGTYVVVSQVHDALPGDNVTFQRHDATGRKLGPAVTVDAVPDGGEPYLGTPSVTALTEGGFVVTWQNATLMGPEQNFARIYNDDGTARGAVIAITPRQDVDTGWSTTLALADGRFAVAWDDGGGSTGLPPRNHLQIYDASGGRIGGELAFATGTDPGGLHFVDLPDGRFFLAWDTRPAGHTAATEHWGQFFAANGTKLGEPTLLFDTTDRDLEYQFAPTYTPLQNGDIVVSWGGLTPESEFDGDGNPVFRSYDTAIPTYSGDATIQTRILTFQTPVTGNGRANTLSGTSGSDRILGLGGADTLRGLAGDDVLVGGTGGDRLEGGAGIDTASYATASAGIGLFLGHVSDNTGNAAGDSYGSVERYVGSRFADIMEGDALRNHLDGGLGNDFLFGLGGADTLVGGLGDDLLEGGTGVDTLDGGVGIDAASYAKAAAGVTASLRAAAGNRGEAAGDTYRSVESLIGSAFADRLSGDGARNRLDGGDGGDTLFGDSGDDFLFGGRGDDRLDGGSGIDRLEGGEGNDTYVVDQAGDRVIEAAGGGTNDGILTSVSYALAATAEVEVLRAGDAGAVTTMKLTGNGIANSLYGDAGANTLDGKGGADRLYGLDGNDTYIVDDARDLVVEAAGGGTRDIVKTSVGYVLKAGQFVEELRTTKDAGRDAIDLTGNEQANTLTGNNGSNVLDGGLGNDLLIGDGVTGGTGKDIFLFDDRLGSANVDRIGDFNPVYDTIQLENTGSGLFSRLAAGALRASEFKDLGVEGAVLDADDHILYDRRTGSLSYDADGTGSAKAIQFAVLNGSPDTFTYRDVFVI